jgi:hypothetical protein
MQQEKLAKYKLRIKALEGSKKPAGMPRQNSVSKMMKVPIDAHQLTFNRQQTQEETHSSTLQPQ